MAVNRVFQSLTGGSPALDGVAVGNIADGERAVVYYNDGTYNRSLFFIFSSSSSAAEDVTVHPFVVNPDGNAGNGRWLEYTVAGTQTIFKIYGNEAGAAQIDLIADQGDDAGDWWRLKGNTDGTLLIQNDTAAKGTPATFVTLSTSVLQLERSRDGVLQIKCSNTSSHASAYSSVKSDGETAYAQLDAWSDAYTAGAPYAGAAGLLWGNHDFVFAPNGSYKLKIDSSGNLIVPEDGKIGISTTTEYIVFDGTGNIIGVRNTLQFDNDYDVAGAVSIRAINELANAAASAFVRAKAQTAYCQLVSYSDTHTAGAPFTGAAGLLGGNHDMFFAPNGVYKMKITTAGIVYMPSVYANNVGTVRDLLIDSNGQLGYDASSIRYKEDVKDIENSLATIRALRPVAYTIKRTQQQSYGFIAEEVEEIDPLFISYNENGEPETVVKSMLFAHIVKAIQELDSKLLTLKTDMARG